MNAIAFLGILLVIYAVFVIYITVKKPDRIWNMSKIKIIRKILGDTGTQIFFCVVSVAAAAVGIWLMIK
jgi:hypothetical protein